MPNIFQTSVSGLLAFQRSLATTSHNISNVNTEGYSRQRVELGTRTPTGLGDGFIGNGVEAKTVRRVFDQARQTAVETGTAEFKRLEIFADYAGRMDDLLADQSAGVSPAMQDFFNAVQDVSNDPTSSTARQALLTQGDNLASRFQFLDDRFRSLGQDVDRQLDVRVATINEIASSIAELNESIVAERGRTGGQPPNDLLDKRDKLLTDLSEQIGTDVVEQDDGAVNVFIGNGQTLVSAFRSNELQVIDNVDDPRQRDIALASPGGTPVNVTANLTGGELGGVLDFRRELLSPARDELGRLATSVALAFNQQHRLGMQYDLGPAGELGDRFFNAGEPQVLSRATNSNQIQPDVSINRDGAGALTGSNYRATFDGTDWSIRRLSDGQETTLSGATGSLSVDGITIDMGTYTAAGETPAAGDSFLIRPTRYGAQELSVNLTRPAQVAAAAPLVAEEATDANGQAINSGTGAIGDLAVTSTDNLPPAAGVEPFTLTFDATANEFNVTDAGGNPIGTIAYDPASDANGLTVDASSPAWTPAGSPSLLEYGDMRFTLSGVPEDGDRFTISRNRNARGDNTNALALGGLAEDSIVDGGDATFQEVYSGLVGEVGTSTMRAEVNRDAQESVRDQAVAAREQVSGVNLDEEAANLLKFQKGYQASAQAVSIANTLFDSLLTAVR